MVPNQARNAQKMELSAPEQGLKKATKKSFNRLTLLLGRLVNKERPRE
jgi:hypothetical protein